MKPTFLILCVAVLAGCATAPKPMTDHQYHEYSKLRSGFFQCGRSGQLAPDLASRGMTFMDASLSKFTYDQARLQSVLKLYADKPVDQGDCNELAMGMSEMTRQVQTTSVTPSQINNRPVQTYCNRIGTQTFCNSF